MATKIRDKLEGAEDVGYGAQDAALVAEAQRNLFANARDLKAATNFPGQKSTVISRLKEAGLMLRRRLYLTMNFNYTA
jgi:hypothetical protein